MKIYFTRHGQVIPSEFMGDELYQKSDRPLTPLGEEQAVLLGKKLHEIGFRGKIYSSPFRRALQTSERIAGETGSVIVPVGWLHECFTNEESARTFRGMTIEQIRERFSHIDPEAELSSPWFAGKCETPEEVASRVAGGIPGVIAKGEDCLFVGHGASMRGVRVFFGIDHPKGLQTWNCALSEVEAVEGCFTCLRYLDISFFPADKVSSNGKLKLQFDAEQNQQ